MCAYWPLYLKSLHNFRKDTSIQKQKFSHWKSHRNHVSVILSAR